MSGWTDGDNMTDKRRNREWIATRLLTPTYDINSGGTVTAAAKPVDGVAVTTGEATHYTASASCTVAVVQAIRITNNDTSDNQVSVHLIPNGGSRQVANRIVSDTLTASDSLTLRGPWFVDPSDTLRSISSGATGTDVALRAEVLELTGMPAGTTLIVDDGDALTNAYATYYTCPASNVQHSNVVAITICNTDSSDRVVNVQVIPSGQSASDARMVFADTVWAGETVIVGGADDPIVLEPGDFIQAKAATGSVVSLRVTALELATS